MVNRYSSKAKAAIFNIGFALAGRSWGIFQEMKYQGEFKNDGYQNYQLLSLQDDRRKERLWASLSYNKRSWNTMRTWHG